MKNRLFHLHALNLEDQSKIRRNSANDADRNNPLEDWNGSISQPMPIQEKKSPTELKHMLLERIHSESPSTLVSITSNQPIRRRRRYDSEPAMATPHVQVGTVQVRSTQRSLADNMLGIIFSEINVENSLTRKNSFLTRRNFFFFHFRRQVIFRIFHRFLLF